MVLPRTSCRSSEAAGPVVNQGRRKIFRQSWLTAFCCDFFQTYRPRSISSHHLHQGRKAPCPARSGCLRLSASPSVSRTLPARPCRYELAKPHAINIAGRWLIALQTRDYTDMRSCECERGCSPPELFAANDNDPRGGLTVTLPVTATVMQQAAVQRLAMAIQSLSLSRRQIPDWMADTIYRFEGTIRLSDGSRFCMCRVDIDAAFNDDGSFRWLSDFLRFANAPPRQAPQRRVLKRLQLLLLALMIARPEIAQHVLR